MTSNAFVTVETHKEFFSYREIYEILLNRLHTESCEIIKQFEYRNIIEINNEIVYLTNESILKRSYTGNSEIIEPLHVRLLNRIYAGGSENMKQIVYWNVYERNK